MEIKNQLENIVSSGETQEIRDVASFYLQFYQEGFVGSNSVGLLYFLQEPRKYIEELGNELIGIVY